MNNERIKYIDILKGIAIILVVLGHVELFIVKETGVFITIISAIHVPTFIFLSGFLSYKKTTKRGFGNLQVLFIDKFKRLIIPFFVVSFTYSFIFKINYSQLFESSYKYGYWFTLVLFYLYIIYLITNIISRTFDTMWKDIVLYSVIYIIISLIFYSHIIPTKVFNILSYQQIIFYFPVFTFGVLMKKYIQFYEIVTKNNILQFLSLIIFVFCIILYDNFKIDNLPLLILSNTTGVYSLISIVRGMEKSRVINNKLLNSIGTKSLEIYLIHFFLLVPLKIMDLYSYTDKSLFMNIIFVLTISTIVISITVFIVTIINKSSVLNKILFGNK